MDKQTSRIKNSAYLLAPIRLQTDLVAALVLHVSRYKQATESNEN